MSVPLRANISRGNPEKVFDLIEKVGGGTYGDVFKARVISTGELAAVKVVKVEPGKKSLIYDSSLIEIMSTIPVLRRRDKLWIAMEFCGAGSAQDIYCVTGPCSEPQISFISVETLKGLAYLHEKNLMHRDIKGANILLTAQGNIKALYYIGKRSFVPPTLKDKDKWSPELHSFLKTALQKNPKKRPTADRLLTHPFCGHGYTRAVIQDLLDTYKRKKGDKGNIAGPGDDDDDED
ncbi:hypothetical protein pdam_00022022, partial [Pocillopora damicornis]